MNRSLSSGFKGLRRRVGSGISAIFGRIWAWAEQLWSSRRRGDDDRRPEPALVRSPDQDRVLGPAARPGWLLETPKARLSESCEKPVCSWGLSPAGEPLPSQISHSPEPGSGSGRQAWLREILKTQL